MNNEFTLLVEALTDKILSTKSNPGRQAIATTRGQQIEKAAMIMLQDHPNVESIEEQVFNDDVDEFSNIDIVVNTKDGRRVYIPCARDLWLGTSQQDRLQIVWAKFGGGVFDRHDVCYLCLSPLSDITDKQFTSRARRGVTIQRVINTLIDNNVVMNLDTLWNHLM